MRRRRSIEEKEGVQKEVEEFHICITIKFIYEKDLKKEQERFLELSRVY